MKLGTGDLSLYINHIAVHLFGLSVIYLDDLIEAGSKRFYEFANQTGQQFDAKDRTVKKQNLGVRN